MSLEPRQSNLVETACVHVQAVLAAEAPSGKSKYDMVGSILEAAQAAPEHAPQSGPLHSAISLLREIVGLDSAHLGAPAQALASFTRLGHCLCSLPAAWQHHTLLRTCHRLSAYHPSTGFLKARTAHQTVICITTADRVQNCDPKT